MCRSWKLSSLLNFLQLSHITFLLSLVVGYPVIICMIPFTGMFTPSNSLFIGSFTELLNLSLLRDRRLNLSLPLYPLLRCRSLVPLWSSLFKMYSLKYTCLYEPLYLVIQLVTVLYIMTFILIKMAVFVRIFLS